MNDYTPTTEAIRGRIIQRGIGWGFYGLDEFDRWLAAHDAEKRAEWEAEQGETEWEYGHDCDESRATHHKNPSPQNPWQSMGACTSATDYRRCKAGPWLPVPDTTKNESEDE